MIVRVTITDVNDNPPSFDQSSYTYSVKEDEGIGYLLEPPLVANDLDSGWLRYVTHLRRRDKVRI